MRILADFSAIIYDADDTALATVDFDGDVTQGSSGGEARGQEFMLDSDITLKPNVDYRVVIRPDSASDVNLHGIVVDAAAQMEAWSGGTGVHRTERTDAGSWTETTTRRMSIGLVINGIGLDGGPLINGGPFS